MILAFVKNGELKHFEFKEKIMQQFKDRTVNVIEVVPADRLLSFC